MQLLVYRMLSKLFSLSCFTTYSLFIKKKTLFLMKLLFLYTPHPPLRYDNSGGGRVTRHQKRIRE